MQAVKHHATLVLGESISQVKTRAVVRQRRMAQIMDIVGVVRSCSST
jgi:hypothetical protein